MFDLIMTKFTSLVIIIWLGLLLLRIIEQEGLNPNYSDPSLGIFQQFTVELIIHHL